MLPPGRIDGDGGGHIHVPVRGATPPSIQTVFSVDGSRSHRWQAELLAHSHRKVRQPGSLTRLWSGPERPTAFAGETFWAEPYAPHPVSGDDYAPYNKPAAIQEWLGGVCPPEETVLVVDPDCVFLTPVVDTVERGRPAAQLYSYLDPADDPGAELAARHCRHPSPQGVGVPYLIHRDDLAALAPLWLAKTEAIRGDRRSRELAGWVAEMWGYAFAAAELGLVHEARELCVVQTEDQTEAPIIHYCQNPDDGADRWRWDKWGYRPWEPVPPPPDGTPRALVALVGLLNEWATTQARCLER